MLSLSLIKNNSQITDMARIFINNLNPLYSEKKAIDILTKKIQSYENFDQKYPGFGGFLPWFIILDDGLIPTDDFKNKVPGLDNGQLIWAIYVLMNILEEIGYHELALRYKNHFEIMKKNCVTIFYDGGGRIRAVTRIFNITDKPIKKNYIRDSYWFLDDPYEGELLAFFYVFIW
jgi:hypothetical protein